MSDLQQLRVSDFRSIKGSVDIPLYAPIILLHGANGAGKTSVLAALELALTGDIAAMRRDDPNFVDHLVHQDREQATIRIWDPRSDEDVTSGLTVIQNRRVNWRPVIDKERADFFSEHCYLAQSVLGRLLEIYSRRDSSTDSALTLFVKDLLRLDELDALVDGLYDADHLARAKNLVPALRVADQLRREALAKRDKAASHHRALLAELKTKRGELTALLATSVSTQPISDGSLVDVEGVKAVVASSSESGVLSQTLRKRRVLDSLAASWAELPEDAKAQERQRLEEELKVATLASHAWKSSVGVHLTELIEGLRGLFPDLPSWSATNPESAHAAAQIRVVAEVKRLESRLAQEKRARLLETELMADVARAESRLKVVDEQIAGISSQVGGLGRALSEMVPYIADNACPLCGQDFNQPGHDTLFSFVQQRIAEFTEQAGRLSALTVERRQVQGRLDEAARQVTTARASLLGGEELFELQKRQVSLGPPLRELNELGDKVVQGVLFFKRQAEAERRLAELRDRDRLSADLRASVAALAIELSEPELTPDESVPEAIDRLHAALQKYAEVLELRTKAQASALKCLDEIGALQQDATAARKLELQCDEDHRLLDQAFMESERLRGQVRVVRGAAVDARSSIVRRVFNEGLNKLWRDLFVRLAPTEPYVPAFQLPETAEGVLAQLETRTRSGGRGGTPGSMLSAGNLNTAALTLFLALHLSVDPKLPWLVLDDPVQSMDEVHIARFAALLRTVSKDHNRKVILAVHDRPLFEYLKLELSPAFHNDQLITVELRRSAIDETFAVSDVLGYQADAVIAA